MDILMYVLLAAVLALGAALAITLTRRSNTHAQTATQAALADTVQRVEQSLRDQERTLAGLVNALSGKIYQPIGEGELEAEARMLADGLREERGDAMPAEMYRRGNAQGAARRGAFGGKHVCGVKLGQHGLAPLII